MLVYPGNVHRANAEEVWSLYEAVALLRARSRNVTLVRNGTDYMRSDPDLIYMDGNSLGRLPAATPGHVEDIVAVQWGDRLIRSWNEGVATAFWKASLSLATTSSGIPSKISSKDRCVCGNVVSALESYAESRDG